MKKVVRITESQLRSIIKRNLKEQNAIGGGGGFNIDDPGRGEINIPLTKDECKILIEICGYDWDEHGLERHQAEMIWAISDKIQSISGIKEENPEE